MQLEQDRWTKPAAGTGYVDETCSWDRIGGECCGLERLNHLLRDQIIEEAAERRVDRSD